MPYCTHCGQLNAPGNKFCESCGKLIITSEPRPAQQPSTARSPESLAVAAYQRPKWMCILPSGGGLLVLICFFFPWVLVSCQVNLGARSSVSAAGYEIASGHYSALQGLQNAAGLFGSAYSDYGTQAPAFPLLWLIPILGLGALVALNGKASGGVIAMCAAILGLLGLIIFSVKGSEFNRQLQTAAFEMTYQPGFWGTWLGFLWQAGTSLLALRSTT